MPATYRHDVIVHWGDTDPAKIVFYPNYFAWMDQSVRMFFESVGLDWDTMMATYGVAGLPIIEAKANFLAPCVFRDQIVVETRIGEWQDKTFRCDHVIYNHGRPAVEGYERRVWAKPRPEDPKRLKAHSIPPEVRARFEP